MSAPTEAGVPNSTIALWWGKPDGTRVEVTVQLPPEPWWDEVMPGDTIEMPVMRVLQTTERISNEPPTPLRAL